MRSDDSIRIGEVARRAGVPVSTVKFYLKEGLLPPPLATGRNTARYGVDTVDRVRLIRELQDKAFVPLKIVRQLLERTSDPTLLRRFARMPWLWDRGGADGVPATALIANGAFTADELGRLEAERFVTPETRDGELHYGALDAALLETLGRIKQLGLTRDRGFGAERLAFYREALEKLVQQELAFVVEGLAGRAPSSEVLASAEEIVECASEMIALLHRKIVSELLRKLVGGTPSTENEETS